MISSYNADALAPSTLNEKQRLAVRDSILSLRKDYYQELFTFADVKMTGENSPENQVAGSDDFQQNGVTVFGVSPSSPFKFKVFAKFSEEELKDLLALAAKKFNSSLYKKKLSSNISNLLRQK